MMGEEGVDELKLGHIMMDSLRKSFEQVHAHYEKVERDLEERRKQMALKEEKLSSLEAQTPEQLDAKRKEVALQEGRLHSCSQKLKCRKMELESVMQSLSDSSTQLATMKQELVIIQKSIEERSKEVLLKEQLLATMEKSLKELSARVELKKKELNSVEKARAEQHKELELMEKESVSLRRSLEERLRGVEMKEMQLEGRAKELDFKRNEIDAVQQTVEELKKELEGKRKLHDLQKESLEERFRLVDMKEEELQVRSRELESKGRKMDAYRRAIDDQRKVLEEIEKRLTGNGPRSDSVLSVNDGCSLQILLNELLTKHALVHDQFSSAIKTSDNPAKLILDAVQGSYSPLGNNRVYEPEIVKKTCILLLDQLLVVNPPQIEPHVQNAAIQLAVVWKEKMKVGAEDQLEILRFLHLVAAFRISPAFRLDEYGALLDRIGDKNKALKLRHHLGMTETAKASSIPHTVKTEELDRLAVSNNGVNWSSHSAAAASASAYTLPGWLNKRHRTTRGSHCLF